MEHLTEEQLFDYLDGSCTEEAQQLYKTHLAQCPACRALYDEYRAIDAQLAAVTLERAPDHFTDKLMAAWEDSRQVQVTWAYRRSGSLLWAAAAAAFALLFVAFYYLTSTGQLPVQVQEQTYTFSTRLPGASLNVSILTTFFRQEWLLNGFLLLNALLGLLLFDKLVLKPFFQKKREALAG